MTLQVALSVQDEIQSRVNDADDMRKKQVERAKYECELSRRRYMQVDPDNRLVAGSLEADWNDRLRQLQEAHQDYEKQSQKDKQLLSEQQRKEILALASDFPRLWSDPKTAQRDRKRLVRLIIDDVTLRKGTDINLDVRFKGGATCSLRLPLPLNSWQQRQTAPAVIQEIDRLLNHHSLGEIANILNQNGLRSGEGKPFHTELISKLCMRYNLKSRHERERERGLLTRKEIAGLLKVSVEQVSKLCKGGYLNAHTSTRSHRDVLYEPPTSTQIRLISRIPAKQTGRPRKLIV
jgi:hypothetical protein